MSDTLLYFGGEVWSEFLYRFIIFIISLFILVRFIFYKYNGESKFIFIYVVSGLMIFLISSTLDQVKLDMGFAFGLFAIFGIIRYRTPSIELKEMTYLLVVIGMGVINGLVEFNVVDWLGLVIANAIIMGTSLLLENYKPKKQVLRKQLIFTPSNYQVLENKEMLVEDIKEIVGIEVQKAEVLKINKVRDEVTILVTFALKN